MLYKQINLKLIKMMDLFVGKKYQMVVRNLIQKYKSFKFLNEIIVYK